MEGRRSWQGNRLRRLHLDGDVASRLAIGIGLEDPLGREEQPFAARLVMAQVHASWKTRFRVLVRHRRMIQIRQWTVSGRQAPGGTLPST